MPDPAAVELVPEGFARQHMLAPVAFTSGDRWRSCRRTRSTCWRSTSCSASSARPIAVTCGTAQNVRNLIERCYTDRTGVHRPGARRVSTPSPGRAVDVATEESPVVRLLETADQRRHRQGRDRSARRAGGPVGAHPPPHRRRADPERHDPEGAARAARQPHQGARRPRHHRAAPAAGRPHLADGQRPPRRPARRDVSDDLRREGGGPHPREGEAGARPRRARVHARRTTRCSATSSASRAASSWSPGRPAPARRRRSIRRSPTWRAPSATS